MLPVYADKSYSPFKYLKSAKPMSASASPEDLKNMLRKATFIDASSFAKKQAHNGNSNQNIKV
jgi:hypothetical protein